MRLYRRVSAMAFAVAPLLGSCSILFDSEPSKPGTSGPRPIVEYHFDDTFTADGLVWIRDSSGSSPSYDMAFEPGDQDLVGLSCTGDDIAMIFPSGQDIQLGVPLAPDGLIDACVDSNALTIEAWFTPASNDLSGPARIVSLAPDVTIEAFMLGQEGSNASLRIFGATSRDLTVEANLSAGSLHYTAVVAADGILDLWQENVILRMSDYEGSLSNWITVDNLRLTVANVVGGSRPWAGKLHYVAVYCEGLSAEVLTEHALAGPPLDPKSSRQVLCDSP